MSGPEVLVVGAGVVGACVALRLAQGGARVTVLEAGRPRAGASGASFAWTNSFNKTPRAYHDLNVAGMAEHDALARDLGGHWLHRVGNLKWEAPERQANLRDAVAGSVPGAMRWRRCPPGRRASWSPSSRSGSAAAEVARLARARLAVGHEPGRLVYTAPVATALRRLIHAHFRPDGGGRIVLVDDAQDLVIDHRPDEWSPERSVASAARYLPALAAVPVEAVRIGRRPMPADRLPAVGPVPSVEGLYLVVSHSGVTLAPIWGRLATAEILSGESAARLDRFRPATSPHPGRAHRVDLPRSSPGQTPRSA